MMYEKSYFDLNDKVKIPKGDRTDEQFDILYMKMLLKYKETLITELREELKTSTKPIQHETCKVFEKDNERLLLNLERVNAQAMSLKDERDAHKATIDQYSRDLYDLRYNKITELQRANKQIVDLQALNRDLKASNDRSFAERKHAQQQLEIANGHTATMHAQSNIYLMQLTQVLKDNEALKAHNKRLQGL